MKRRSARSLCASLSPLIVCSLLLHLLEVMRHLFLATPSVRVVRFAKYFLSLIISLFPFSIRIDTNTPGNLSEAVQFE